MSYPLKRAGFLSLSLLIVSIAQADDPSEPLPSVYITAERPEDYTSETAATAKTATPLRDVPQSISVMTREILDDLNTQNIGQALQYVPGVGTAQGEGNRETPVIRGSSSTGDFFLDGLRDDVQYYRDLYNIERLEVLRGPNGALFGRGGVGGIINRVSKEARFDAAQGLTLELGSYDHKRSTADFGRVLADDLAFRINGVYEDSDSYRDDVTLKRYGVNPNLTWRLGEHTRANFGVEYFHDERVADRGVSSYLGRPLDTDPGAFFGDPDQSHAEAHVRMANLLLEHRFSDTVLLRHHARYADYDKFYQNVFPGVVNPLGNEVRISAYNNDTQRENLFNQTDLYFTAQTGRITHRFLTGVEFGRQDTQNVRNTGYFDSVAPDTTFVNVPVTDPRTNLPLSWRQSATDADNDGTARIAAGYLQDEVRVSSKFTVVAGLRYDRFTVDLRNHRTGADLSSKDHLLSPRLALVFKPTEATSLYATYSLAYQPRAGDQLSSLSATNEALDPERFTNYELGFKWDVTEHLAFTSAVFQLERTHVAIADPLDPTRSILIDGQRNRGLEIGWTGNLTEPWSVTAAAAYQQAEILSDQSAFVQKGAALASVPRISVSLWNRYTLSSRWGLGLGVVHRGEIFAATEDLLTPSSNVTLQRFTRLDGAVFYTLNDHWRAQLHLENLLNERYFQYAHSNTNITPGSPRAARIVVSLRF